MGDASIQFVIEVFNSVKSDPLKSVAMVAVFLCAYLIVADRKRRESDFKKFETKIDGWSESLTNHSNALIQTEQSIKNEVFNLKREIFDKMEELRSFANKLRSESYEKIDEFKSTLDQFEKRIHKLENAEKRFLKRNQIGEITDEYVAAHEKLKQEFENLKKQMEGIGKRGLSKSVPNNPTV